MGKFKKELALKKQKLKRKLTKEEIEEIKKKHKGKNYTKKKVK